MIALKQPVVACRYRKSLGSKGRPYVHPPLFSINRNITMAAMASIMPRNR
jgi:hypothetical protein